MDNELLGKQIINIIDETKLFTATDGKLGKSRTNALDSIMQLVRQSNRELLERLKTKEVSIPPNASMVVYSVNIDELAAALQEPEDKTISATFYKTDLDDGKLEEQS